MQTGSDPTLANRLTGVSGGSILNLVLCCYVIFNVVIYAIGAQQ